MMYIVKIILKYCITQILKWSSSKPATLFGLAPLTGSFYVLLHTLINLFESIYSLYCIFISYHKLLPTLPVQYLYSYQLALSLDSLMDDVMELSMGDDASTGKCIYLYYNNMTR